MNNDELDKIINNGLARLNDKAFDEKLKRDSEKEFLNKQIFFISALTVATTALLIISWLISMTVFYTVVVWSYPIVGIVMAFYIVVLTQSIDSLDGTIAIGVISTIGFILGFNLYESVLTDAIKEGYEFYIPIINQLIDLGI